jgi:hypothetical protein
MSAEQVTDYAGGGALAHHRRETPPPKKRAALTIISDTVSRRKVDKSDNCAVPFVPTERPKSTATLGQTLNQRDLAKCIQEILSKHKATSVIDYGSGDGTALATFERASGGRITQCVGLELLPSPPGQHNVIGGFDCANRAPGDLTGLSPSQRSLLRAVRRKTNKIHYCYYGGILPTNVVIGMLKWMQWSWAQGDILMLVGPSDKDLVISSNPGAKETASMAVDILGVHPTIIRKYPVAEAGTDITGNPLKPTMFISVYAKRTASTTSWYVSKAL